MILPKKKEYGRGKGCWMISLWRPYNGSGKVGAGYSQLGVMAMESGSLPSEFQVFVTQIVP